MKYHYFKRANGIITIESLDAAKESNKVAHLPDTEVDRYEVRIDAANNLLFVTSDKGLSLVVEVGTDSVTVNDVAFSGTLQELRDLLKKDVFLILPSKDAETGDL